VTTQGNDASQFGRVDGEGTVYVRVGEDEHVVGQYPEGTPEEALAFFTRRYDGQAFEVGLLEQRIHNGALGPDEATAAIEQVAGQLTPPNSVGDIVALTARLDALRPLIAQQKVARREERARRVEEARNRKGEIANEAEKLAGGRDWRNGANRLRELLEEWKALPRLDRRTDDELWHRFSAARTTYTKARKAHFAEVGEKRDAAQVVKERLIKEAEALSDSTEWGQTAGRYRDLMQQWKAAGPAPRKVDEQLWQRFRAAQDQFFGARDSALSAQDEEFRGNAEKKQQILAEAEALVPVTDLDAAKRAFRSLSERWDAAGKVPRDQVRDLEGRMRKVEQAIRSVEDDQWKRSDPEKSARADDMVAMLSSGIADVEAKLEKARAAGDQKKVADLESDLASRQAFLEAARKAASEFS
jgi:hypothetical protein